MIQLGFINRVSLSVVITSSRLLYYFLVPDREDWEGTLD